MEVSTAKNILPDDIREICKRCAHRPTCKTLCYPVLLYLYRADPPVVEYKAKRRDEEIKIVFPQHKQIQATQLEEKRYFFDQLFNPDSAFSGADYDKNLLLTRIFVDRFFKQDSFKDIALRYDMHFMAVRQKYDQALRAITALLQFFYSVSSEQKSKNRAEHKKKALFVMQMLKKDKGMSNRQIADYLTARRFPTHYKTARPGSWSKKTVQRYLAEAKNDK